MLVRPTRLRINPRRHFLDSKEKRQFDLSVLVPMYLYVSKNLGSIDRDIDHEFSIGRSTVVYSVDANDTIHLITGWVGNRKKAQI